MNENNQKVEEMSTFVHLSCHYCGNTYETEDEQELDFDGMSGAWNKPCPKCNHTMWESEE